MRADKEEDMTMTRIRTLLGLAGLMALLVLVTGGACDPQAGDKCDNPGSFSTRVDHGKRTSLSCEPSGIDQHGHQIYRWTKA